MFSIRRRLLGFVSRLGAELYPWCVASSWMGLLRMCLLLGTVFRNLTSRCPSLYWLYWSTGFVDSIFRLVCYRRLGAFHTGRYQSRFPVSHCVSWTVVVAAPGYPHCLHNKRNVRVPFLTHMRICDDGTYDRADFGCISKVCWPGYWPPLFLLLVSDTFV